jgi:hypothetical protein
MADAPKPAHDTKAAPVPAAMKKPPAADEAGDDAKPKKVMLKPVPSTGRHIGRGLIVASVVIAAAWIIQARFADRYQLVPVQTQENTFMYRLDRFSGAVHFCTAQVCTELPVRGPQ